MNPADDTMADLAGFHDIARVGRGGLGHVYRAVRDSTGATVALKVLHDVSDESAVWKRTRREVSALASLNGHAHVIQVYDTLELSGAPILIIEYAPGGSIASMMTERGTTLDPGECLLIARHTAGALEAAHARGIVHRDIKPQNLLIDAYGQVKLCDFGIATLARSPEFRDRTSSISMRYASPEDLEHDDAIGPPADIYSLGATLLHLAHGAPPTLRERLQPWRRPTAGTESLDAVDTILEACLQPEPGDRPTATELIGLIESVDPDPLRRLGEEADSSAMDDHDADDDDLVVVGGDPLISFADEPPIEYETVARARRPPLAARPAAATDNLRRRNIWVGATALVVLIVLGGWWWLGRDSEPNATTPRVATPSTTANVATTAASIAPTSVVTTPPTTAPTQPMLSDIPPVVADPDGLAAVTERSWRWPMGAPGECFNREAGGLVGGVDCAEPHDVQRYGSGEVDVDEFDAVSARTRQHCATAFVEFVFGGSVDNRETALASFIAQPSAGSWAEGDRSYQCFLYHDGGRLVGDAAATGW